MRNFRPKDGECWNDVNKRAEQFIKALIKKEFSRRPANVPVKSVAKKKKFTKKKRKKKKIEEEKEDGGFMISGTKIK
jgi:hypothetical protein